MPQTPDRIALGEGLSISRLVCGLWQVADLEKNGTTLDPDAAADALAGLCRGRLRHVRHGRSLRQRRDHHRPAAGALSRCRSPARRLHQMVPRAGADDAGHRAQGRPGAARPARRRQGRPAAVPLVDFRASGLARRAARDGAAEGRGSDRRHRRHQFRCRASARWRWPTAFRSPPTRCRSRWSTAAPPANSRRSAWRGACGCSPMARCAAASSPSKWLGKPEPETIADWSRSKYKRFIDVAGGWAGVPGHPCAPPPRSRRKHGVSISNVATRWVLEHEAVAAAIIGARIGESEHRADNLKLFGFALDDDDQAASRGSLRRDDADPGRLRRRIPQAALPHRLGRPQPSSRRACPRSTAPNPYRAGRAGSASLPAACGSRSPATAGRSGSRTRSASPAPRPRMATTAAWRRATRPRRPPTSSTRSPLR